MSNANGGLAGLLEILSWARPHDSETEKRFCKEFLDVIPGMKQDAFGNRILRIGDLPIMWSSHVDTVAAKGGPQAVAVDGNGIAALVNGKPGMSLGADDGAGIWIMLNMIAAKRPGLYVFHRGEERGCLGSRWIVDNTPELLTRMDAAIAFDRAHLGDVITHQAYGRTCSDAFAKSMSGALNDLNTAFRYEPDDTGVYTDTNEYAAHIPECTNLSVGYAANHGPRETLDVKHCQRLLAAMLKLDASKLVIDRDPAVEDSCWYDRWEKPYVPDKPDDYVKAILANPEVAASLLEEAGIDLQDFRWAAWSTPDTYHPLAQS